MEPGVSGRHGLCVTRVVMVEREEDIGSVTIRSPFMEVLTAPETDMKNRIVIHKAVRVS